MSFGNILGDVVNAVAPGVGSLLGNVLGGGPNSGLSQVQASMQQTQLQQEQMFGLQQQSDAFAEKMQTMAAIEHSMDDTVKAMAQDIR